MFLYQNKMIRGGWTHPETGAFYPDGWFAGATPDQLAEVGVVSAPDIPQPEHDPTTHRADPQDDGSWLLVELPPPPVPASVSPAQIRIALNQLNLRQMVEAAVATGSQDLKDWWEYSTEVRRDNVLVNQMAQALGVSSEQLDGIFQLAATL